MCIPQFRVATENELANQADSDLQMQLDSNGTTPDGEICEEQNIKYNQVQTVL